MHRVEVREKGVSFITLLKCWSNQLRNHVKLAIAKTLVGRQRLFSIYFAEVADQGLEQQNHIEIAMEKIY